jgi:hypothetical protein
MTLDPAQYECPEDKTDLTAMVEEALVDDGEPVAYLGVVSRDYRRSRPFKVIVTCPGADGAAPHRVTCSGTHTR